MSTTIVFPNCIASSNRFDTRIAFIQTLHTTIFHYNTSARNAITINNPIVPNRTPSIAIL